MKEFYLSPCGGGKVSPQTLFILTQVNFRVRILPHDGNQFLNSPPEEGYKISENCQFFSNFEETRGSKKYFVKISQMLEI